MDSRLPEEAWKESAFGWGAFISILRSLEQNCFLLNLPDGRCSVDAALFHRIIAGVKSPAQRSQLSKLVKILAARTIQLDIGSEDSPGISQIRMTTLGT
jgi:hypothetical protein